MRSRHGINRRAYAHSYDGGETWTEVEYDPELPEPSCQGSVVRLDEGRVLLSHPANTETRTHLTVRMSYDECRAWPVSKVLHEGYASYSDLAVTDGHILCYYETGQGGRMILARFTPEWLEG